MSDSVIVDKEVRVIPKLPSCNCKYLHKCLANKSTQTPELEEGLLALRSIDLIEFPKVPFKSAYVGKDCSTQVDLLSLEERIGRTFSDKSVSAQGSSLYFDPSIEQQRLEEEEEITRRFDTIIQTYGTPTIRFRHKRKLEPIPWIEEAQRDLEIEKQGQDQAD